MANKVIVAITLLTMMILMGCSRQTKNENLTFSEYKIFFEKHRMLFEQLVDECTKNKLLKRFDLKRSELFYYDENKSKTDKPALISTLSKLLKKINSDELTCTKNLSNDLVELKAVRISLYASGVVTGGNYVGVFYWPAKFDNLGSFSEEELYRHNSELKRLDETQWYFKSSF